MYEAAEQISSLDPREPRVAGWKRPAAVEWWVEVERAVWSVRVVVLDVDAQDVVELSPAEDQQPIEAVVSDGAHPALGVGVRVRPPGALWILPEEPV